MQEIQRLKKLINNLANKGARGKCDISPTPCNVGVGRGYISSNHLDKILCLRIKFNQNTSSDLLLFPDNAVLIGKLRINCSFSSDFRISKKTKCNFLDRVPDFNYLVSHMSIGKKIRIGRNVAT